MTSTVSSTRPQSETVVPASAGTVAVIACLTTCLAVASVYIMQPVLAELASRFDISGTDARLAFSVVSIAYALAFFFLGPLSDRVEPRTMAMVGLLAAAIAVGLGSLIGVYEHLLILLAVQGAFAAMVPAAMFALVPRIAPKERMGTYFGFVIAASVVGITLGRSSMGLMTAKWGLSSAMQVCGLALVLAAAFNQLLPISARSDTTKVTVRQAYGNALRMLAAGRLLRLFGIGFLLFFGYLGMLTFLTLRLHQAPFMFDSAAIGSVSLLGLSALFGAPLSGRLVARIGSLPVALGGLFIVMAAIVCLALARTELVLIAGLFLLFLGVFSCRGTADIRAKTGLSVPLLTLSSLNLQ
ncbi:MAG: MFS transporter [Burkholderiales bacterium]|nr:MFS transporter [Burkholderiales bacterium]